MHPLRRAAPVISGLLAVSVALLACERQQRGIGGSSGAALDQPQYSVAAQVAAPPALAYVSEVAPRQAATELDPEALFVKNCSACHQANGQGIPGVFPPLDGSVYVTGDNVERLAAIMVYGLMGPIKVRDVTYNNVMAPLGAALKDEELAKIATYIRSSWSNKAGPVDPEVFAAVRQKHGTRGMFNITELGEETGS